jgi:hypothetical protein
VSGFAERYGYVLISADLNDTEMPSSLRSGLWDVVSSCYFSDIFDRHSSFGGSYSKYFKALTGNIWFQHFREPIDTRPQYSSDALKYIRSRFFSWEFYKVYQFLEFIISMKPEGNVKKEDIVGALNSLLTRERAAFRFVNGLLVKISDENQLAEIADAAQSPSEAVGEHIRLAAKHYSSAENPDYRNSIKESISAVEAAVSFVVGRKTSGITKPLKSIAEKYQIHQALRDGFEKIYAWTSDDSGIRHRLMGKSTVTQEDARFMLISCSAFANYLIALRVKFGEVREEQ